LNPPPPELLPTLIHRSDDTVEAIVVRLETYKSTIAGIEHLFQKQMVTLDGNRNKKVVFEEIKQSIETI
jgi:adenylate kinase family enzyme